MKKTPLFITIPFVAVLIVIGIALALKTFAPKQQVEVLKPTEFPNSVGSETVSKPSTFLGSLFGQKQAVSTPTPTPSSASDLSKELKETYDDGGQAELDALSKDAASL